jgi:mannose-6-phosphate isomerase-like protein (cupin superfamily)
MRQRILLITLCTLGTLGTPGTLVLAQTTPPPAPAPGSPAIFKSAADLAEVLRKAKVNPGGMSSSNVTTTDQYRVSIVKRDKAAGALAHPGNTELLYIVEGEGTMVTGGKLVAAADGKPASIVDGVSRRFAARLAPLVLGRRKARDVSRSALGGARPSLTLRPGRLL